MPRMVKEENYAIKRNEILDVALKLVYTKGYERMSIQDILEALQISKGAFYHYFDSKQVLLDGLVERMYDQVEQLILPIVQDPALTALEKWQHYINIAYQWKTTRKGFLIELVRVWYSDHNAIIRQKQRDMLLDRAAPWFTAILRQGMAEGVFDIAFPEQTSEILLSLISGLGDAWADILLSDPSLPDALPRLERLLAAYTQALERVMGVPSGSITMIDKEKIKEWSTIT